ncbi:hypothetical protein HZB00_04110 [Candidatus Woesearchaeota archaeon]|nr:hypothetical protein [Candidatus Woesearchaeota archaeon]
MILSAAIALFFHEASHAFFARRYAVGYTFGLWNLTRVSLKKKLPKGKGVPVGAILAFFLSFFSRGQLAFSAVTSYQLGPSETARAGRKFIHITDYEEAKIALAGPLANLLLFLLFYALSSRVGFLSGFAWMNFVMALCYLLPLPGLDGLRMFFGSRSLYVFSLALLFFLFLLKDAGIFLTIFFTLLLAGIAVFVYYSKKEY